MFLLAEYMVEARFQVSSVERVGTQPTETPRGEFVSGLGPTHANFPFCTLGFAVLCRRRGDVLPNQNPNPLGGRKCVSLSAHSHLEGKPYGVPFLKRNSTPARRKKHWQRNKDVSQRLPCVSAAMGAQNLQPLIETRAAATSER